ncbi:MAG: PEGA domain-containing protein [bacterium]|nr:PEGA domain-containing protein [bacterium]
MVARRTDSKSAKLGEILVKKMLIIAGSIVGFLLVLFLLYWFFVQGRLVVTTGQSDSSISFNGGGVAGGKADERVARGLYDIKIEKSGFVTYMATVHVVGWQTKTLDLSMKRLPESVVLESNITTMVRDGLGKNLLLSEKGGTDFLQFDPINNKKQLLSRVDFGSAIKTKWDPNFFLAYIWRVDGSSGLVDLKRYDLLSQEFAAWNKGVMDLAWNQKGDQVVYVYKPGDGEFSLIKATPLNQEAERLYFHLDKVNIKDPILEWTKDGKDLLVTDDNIFVYNFYSHKLNKITKSGDVKMAKLSMSGEYIVFSDKSGSYICKLDGSGIKKLDVSLDIFEWLPNGVEIIGVTNGEFKKINVQSGLVTDYGYNGSRVKNIDAITVLEGAGSVFYLADNKLVRLDLQPSSVIVE